MRMFIMSVRDVKADQFSRPFFALALGEALRTFQMECENPESMLHRFPDDFRLFRIGEFNQGSGILLGEAPLEVACARDFVKAEALGQLQVVKEVS